MKKYINRILLLFAVTSFLFSCEKVDNAIYDVFDGTERGAVLRTLETLSGNYNIYDSSSIWGIRIEEQDVENGDLLSKVDVYLSFKDNTDDGQDNSKSEILAKTIQASEFIKGDNGLPVTTITFTLSESLGILDLSDGQYSGGDIFTFRLEVTLTDGRTYSADDSSGTLQGSFLASPYMYNAGILCVPDAPFAGDYQIKMQDSYGDGWNGASIDVTIDGVTTSYTLDSGSSGSETITVPNGTEELIFAFSSGAWDEEITFQIITPSGNLGVDAGPSPTVGEIALNLCNE